MPQVDIETLVSVCAGGSTDRKIACETLADDHQTALPEPHPDSPPESVWLSRDEEYDWMDRNAVYERKESTKGNSSSVPNSSNLNPNPNSNNNSILRRFSLNFKSKAPIIGLPKVQKPSFVEAKNRRQHKTSSTTLFPTRSASVGKSVSSLKEPSSPKVSCMGRVRSKHDPNRRFRNSRKSTISEAVAEEKPVRTGKKFGFFESFRAIFRSGRKGKPEKESGSGPKNFVKETKIKKPRDSVSSVNDASFTESISRKSVSESEPPRLGQINRFTSGRRSESWGVSETEIHVS
ncbi:putative calcium/calmodulin-dependent protein kinase [Lupinus albus]|uniref:Putative calcium/calmodulin-dependent protein kinase n=1 Tax=Lupinus albus TaxID=3870 RepID=A0A6A4NFE1_LUPAL|nr:putative calcium/calmodulin-dependent protein kinase [Lupinus albus]